jgi:hypothetical protein
MATSATRPPARRPEGTLSSSERLRVTVPAAGWAERDPDFDRVFADTGEEVAAIAYEESCRCHRWFVAHDGGEWQALEVAPWEARRRPERGERFIVVTQRGEMSERVTRYAASRGDRKAHLAELAQAERALLHPRDGAHAYARSVPLMVEWLRTVDDVLAYLEGLGLRPVLLGTRIALTQPEASPTLTSGGQFHRRPGDADRELLRDWAPLIAARLGGPRLGCDVGGCERAADVALMGTAFACAGHADAAVGAPAVKPGRAGILGAIASAIAS